MNSDILNKYFSCHSKIDVLRTLVFSTEPLSGRQIASRSGLSPRSCQLSLDDLVAMHALHRRPSGKAYFYTLNTDNLVVTDFIIPIVLQEKRMMERAVKLVKKHSDVVEDHVIGLYLLNSWPKAGWKTGDGDLLLLQVSRDGAGSVMTDEKKTATILKQQFGLRVAVKLLSVGDLATSGSQKEDIAGVADTAYTIYGIRFSRLLEEMKAPPEHVRQASDFFKS